MNVGYFERQQGGNNADSFVQWNDPGWLSSGALLGGVRLQRLALYPNQIAKGFDVDANVR